VQIIWDEFLKIIKEEAGSQIVETWFKAVSLDSWDITSKLAILKTPNQFVSNWIQNHYLELLKTHLARLLHTTEISLRFVNKTMNTQEAHKNIIPASVLVTTPPPQPMHSQNNYPRNQLVVKQKKPVAKEESSSINEHYLFDNFIVGPNNSLAHAAAYAISDNLGKVYNPLFIYGGTGLGKTHLMHALGNQVLHNNPALSVRYITADQFINEFINSIRFDRSHQFREKYKKIDLLLLDDIQFLSNKEQTQETFFHIFNTLYEQKKQIVLSSDTFPKEISGLQGRLRSRMEWGLVADIQMPDLETRIAILTKKAGEQKLQLPNDVAHFIASRVLSNIRELEGALIRVSAFSALTHLPISLEMAQKVLLNLNPNDHKKDNSAVLENILKTVARHYSVSLTDLKSKKRHKDIAAVRQIAFYLMKKLTLCSLQTIGSFIGGRDHSTVIHAVSKIEDEIKKDHEFIRKLNIIEQKIMMN